MYLTKEQELREFFSIDEKTGSVEVSNLVALKPEPKNTFEGTAFAQRKNEGKIDFTRLPFDLLEDVARVLEISSKKYKDTPDENHPLGYVENYRKLWGKDTIRVCLGSAFRHIVSILKGEYRDPETGCYHSSHAICNLLFITAYLKEKGK